MSALGIDHGTRRCGIALEIAGIALPKSIVPTALILEELEKLVKQYHIDTLVVGKSPHMKEVKNKSSQEILQGTFVTLIRTHFPTCEVVLQNEGFSSQQARYELEAAGLDSSGHIDDQAAAIILQDYLNSQDSKQ